jgi:hypothetical protein
MSKFFNSSFVKGDFLVYLALFFVGVFVFKPSFSMGLYGDEWQMLWFSKAINIGTYHVLPTDIWNSYMNEMVTFDWLSNIFGYDGRFYYFFSFCCRLLAVYTCYWFFNKRIDSKFVSFLISCLFLVSPVGIEATDWARNFDSYLGIAVLIIVIDKLYELKTLRDVLLAILFSIGLFLINPLRSHGNILVILGLIFVNILGRKNDKYYWMTGFAILSIYLFFIKIQVFGGLTTFKSFAFEEYVPYLKNFIGNIGRVFVPSIDNQQYIFGLIGLLFYIWKNNTFKFFSRFKTFILGGYLISFFFVQFHIISSLPFTKSIYIGSFFIFWFFVVITIDFITRKNEQFKQAVICLLLSSAFLLFPFIRQPHFQAASDHRYLIYSTLTIVFILGFLLQSLQDRARKIIVLCCIGFIILFFTDSTRSYLLNKSISHNYHYSQFIWDQIYYLSKDFNMQKRTNVIFIQNDFTNSSVFGDSVNFGFMFRYGITFNVYQEKYLPYMMVEDKSGIYSLFTDGKRSLAYFPEIKKFNKADTLFFEINNGRVKRLNFEEAISGR